MSLNATAGNYRQAADSYEKGRPSYPQTLVGALPLAAARLIVELGAGTGKFTRLMLPYVKGDATIVAVEPVAEMSARLSAMPGVSIVSSAASETSLADGVADVVVCAQSFHWFDDEASVAEITRILRPGGTLGLIWNTRDERTAWVAPLSRLIDGYARNAPRYQTGRWRWILDDPRFRFERELVEEYRHDLPRDGVAERILSTSYVAGLSDAEKYALRGRIDSLLAENGLADAVTITMPYVSRLYLLSRR